MVADLVGIMIFLLGFALGVWQRRAEKYDLSWQDFKNVGKKSEFLGSTSEPEEEEEVKE